MEKTNEDEMTATNESTPHPVGLEGNTVETIDSSNTPHSQPVGQEENTVHAIDSSNVHPQPVEASQSTNPLQPVETISTHSEDLCSPVSKKQFTFDLTEGFSPSKDFADFVSKAKMGFERITQHYLDACKRYNSLNASLPKLVSDADQNKLRLVKEVEQKVQQLSIRYDSHLKETTQKDSELRSVLKMRKEDYDKLKQEYEKMTEKPPLHFVNAMIEAEKLVNAADLDVKSYEKVRGNSLNDMYMRHQKKRTEFQISIWLRIAEISEKLQRQTTNLNAEIDAARSEMVCLREQRDHARRLLNTYEEQAKEFYSDEPEDNAVDDIENEEDDKKNEDI